MNAHTSRMGRISLAIAMLGGITVWAEAQKPAFELGYTTAELAAKKGPKSPGEMRHDPPPPKQVLVKWLDKEVKSSNALVTVEYEAEDARRLQGGPVKLEGINTELRDDGKKGDEKAGDGIYSVLTRLDFDQVARRAKEAADAPAAKPRAQFKGRVKVGEKKLERLDLPSLRPGGSIRIPDLGVLLGPPPPLPDIKKSLMITDLSVVNDPTRTGEVCAGTGNPRGKWSFGHLMTEMANQSETGIDPRLFVRRWLGRWETSQQVNDQDVAARLQIRNRIIIPWELASGGPGAPLDLAKAPFRLLAIVNRIDLRDNLVYGGGSAGEARFVFCAVDLTNNCEPLRFTVIFEYGIKKNSCTELKAWAQEWANLSTLGFGTPAYNNALEAITEQFVKAGADPTRPPNKSALNQLRTNEFALGILPWQIREFTLDSTSVAGHLQEATTKQTPAPPLNHLSVIAQFVNANIPAILDDKHVVPAMFPGIEPFLGGEALIDPPRAFWDGPKPPPPPPPAPPIPPAIPDREARFHFSFNTCNGCHGGETFPLSLPPPDEVPFFFTHIEQRPANQEARLSSFLTGRLAGSGPGPDVEVTDPADGSPSRIFNDLERRQNDLHDVLTLECGFPFRELFFTPLRMEH